MLEVDNRVIIPELTHTRFVVAAADVIHSYACPALGIKCDAYPGRLNQSSVYLNREGTYFGQKYVEYYTVLCLYQYNLLN
jgi:cytochrome c oxidase subunit 2